MFIMLEILHYTVYLYILDIFKHTDTRTEGLMGRALCYLYSYTVFGTQDRLFY